MPMTAAYGTSPHEIHEFIDVGESGLALEQIADVLSEDEVPISGRSVRTWSPSPRTCRWATACRALWTLPLD
jgi:hypothetical protein